MIVRQTRWTRLRPTKGRTLDTRIMGKAMGVSQSTMWRIWQSHGLQPHRIDCPKLSTDSQFVEKLRDVVGLYLDPPERAVVFSFDEKSQI